MSEIKVDTLTGKTTANDITVTVGASATMSAREGLLISRCLYNQVSPAVRSSVNISSVTDTSTGNQGYNLTNAVSAVDDATPFCQAQPVNNNLGSDNFANPTASSVSSFRGSHWENGTQYDCNFNMFTLHGDLA